MFAALQTAVGTHMWAVHTMRDWRTAPSETAKEKAEMAATAAIKAADETSDILVQLVRGELIGDMTDLSDWPRILSTEAPPSG